MIRLFGWLRPPHSEAALAARREWRVRAAPARDTALDALRFVAVDTETSGLDPARDRLISIGACAVHADGMPLDQCFATLLRQDRPSAADNVLIHGIGRAAQATGAEPEAALCAYLAFARRDVVVGYHTLFDVVVLQRAVRAALGIAYRPQYLDLALILPALQGEGAGWELDRWLERYRLSAFARHDALADAAAAGELLLLALDRARRRGLRTLRQLLRMQRQQLEFVRLGSS